MKPSFRLLTSLLLPVILVLPAARAWANVAANTQIVNQATLTYSGGTAHASVTVTVATINSQATSPSPAPVPWPGLARYPHTD